MVKARQRTLLFVVLLVGLVQGLLYLFIIPPWWHYDEPYHFECINTTAKSSLLHPPQRSGNSSTWKERLQISLLKYDYYHWVSNKPLSRLGSTWCDAPFYYTFSSLPLRIALLQEKSFAAKNRIVRFMSLIMFVAVLSIAWKATGEILPEQHPTRWMTVLFIALLPGFSDVMTSINDDVGAIFAFSISLWIALALVKRGFSSKRLVLLVLSVMFCFYLNKPTSWGSILIAPVALLFSGFRSRRFRWVPWVLLTVSVLSLMLLFAAEDDVRYWYPMNDRVNSTQYEYGNAPFGHRVFRISASGSQAGVIGQIISPKDIKLLSKEKQVTLGVWMWSSKPVKARLPVIRMAFYYNYAPWTKSKYVKLSTKPTFYKLIFNIPSVSKFGWLELYPRPTRVKKGEQVEIFYDGLVLTPGEYDRGVPVFSDGDLSKGIWEGRSFQNIVRNASAERSWLRVRTELVGGKVHRYFSVVNIVLSSIGDWGSAKIYYASTVRSVFRSFWSKTGIWLPAPELFFRLLLLVMILACIGSIALLIRKRNDVSWRVVAVLLETVMLTWGFAFVRGVGHMIKPVTYFNAMTWSRYAFPGILPVALVFSMGAWELMRWLRIPKHLRPAFFALFILLVDISALGKIVLFFHKLHLI